MVVQAGTRFPMLLAVEEIGRACGGTGLSLCSSGKFRCYTILQFRYRRAKARILVPMAQGKTLGSFGLTEPNAGSDAEVLEQKHTSMVMSVLLMVKNVGLQMQAMHDK